MNGFTVGESRGIISHPLPGETVSLLAASKPITSYALRIPDSTNRPMVTIHPDGRIEFGENYDPDEAARRFWDAIKRFAPSPQKQQFGVPLTARINAELARGQQAENLLPGILDVYRSMHAAHVQGHVFEALPGCSICDSAARIRAFQRAAL